MGYSSWGRKVADMTERITLYILEKKVSFFCKNVSDSVSLLY